MTEDLVAHLDSGVQHTAIVQHYMVTQLVSN